jgi:hypothetical protein
MTATGMKRTEYLKQVARQLSEAADRQRESEKEKSDLRDEFFRLVEEGFHEKDHLLPVKTIEVPDTFFKATNMTKAQFVSSRYPGWDVVHCERKVDKFVTIFVLKKNPDYLPYVEEVEYADGRKIRVSKEIAEGTPEIDWETLRAERPDLYEKLAKTVEQIVLNDDALEELADNEPEELATLERHMHVGKPVRRAFPRKVKDDDGD